MQHISSAKKVGVRILCGACLAMPLTSAFAADISDVNLDWGGYAKLAVLFSHFQDGAVQQGIGRDFYVPNTTPVLAPGANEVPHNYLDFQAKETRLFLKGSSNVQGHQVGGYVEMDFLSDQNLVNTTVTTTTPGASEATTNAYTPSLRRAYLTVDNWLLGQDWTTFQNVSALPDVVDYIGPTEGTVFVRQPLIRYTLGGLQVALENPETTTAAHAGAAFSNTDGNSIPDLVLRYNLRAGPGTYSFAALGRQ